MIEVMPGRRLSTETQKLQTKRNGCDGKR